MGKRRRSLGEIKLNDLKPRYYLLAASQIADDPRVRRMGDRLHAMGRNVMGVGLPGARSVPPDWPILSVNLPERVVTQTIAAKVERKLVSLAVSPMIPAAALLDMAGSAHARSVRDIRTHIRGLNRPVLGLLQSAERRLSAVYLSPEKQLHGKFWRMWPVAAVLRSAAQSLPGPAIFVANDWQMLPVAAAAAEKAGGIAVYDSHELATEEYAERPEWRRAVRPVVAGIESRYVKNARVISSVSPGITAHLQKTYSVSAPHFTLRNAPTYQATPFRPAGRPIRVLYHGIVAPGRGLEASIESVACWPAEFSLTIRGPSSLPGYTEQLAALSAAKGVASRVVFAPPVAMTALVAEARSFDIGLMALPGHSLHNQFALPNKVFEYLMAGLAIAVSDLPEMATLVRENGAGFLVGDGSSAAIAAAINALSPDALNAQRARALEAAKIYNWETESAAVIDAYESAFRAAIG